MSLITALILAGGLLASTTTTIHANALIQPCQRPYWREIASASKSTQGVANINVHLWEYTDVFQDNCGQIYTHVDIYLWQHQSNIIVVAQENAEAAASIDSNDLPGYSETLSASSSGTWFHYDVPKYTYSGCGIDGFGEVIPSNGPLYAATTGTNC